MREKIKLLSSAGTGHFYVTTKNKRLHPDKLEVRKFDPVARKHVAYKEVEDQVAARPLRPRRSAGMPELPRSRPRARDRAHRARHAAIRGAAICMTAAALAGGARAARKLPVSAS